MTALSATDQEHPVRRDKYLKQLLDGHRHGAYALPDSIVEAWELANRAAVQKPSGKPPRSEAEVWEQLLAEDVEAFHKGAPAPDPAAVLAERRGAEQRFVVNEKMRISRTARLEHELVDLVAAEKDTIIIHSLRPSLAEVVEELAQVVRILPEDATEATCLRGTDRVRRSWLKAEAISARYGALRGGWRALKPQPGLDEHGEFAELRNLNAPDIWPQPQHRNVVQASQPPWPQEPTLRLLWLQRRGGEFWLPLDHECDAAYRKHYADRLEDQERNHAAAQQWRAVFA